MGNCREQYNTIIEDLLRLGVINGDIMLVHSSLSSLGMVDGGAKTVLDALECAVGESGTLLMPALSYDSVNSENPIFSASETPVCTGAISEYFRTRKGTLRSLHPTHSVCAGGRLAGEMVSGHKSDNTPVGAHSPFSMLARLHGKILMLGCGLCPNTSMHGVEELSRPPYLFKKEKTLFTLIDGKNNRRTDEYYCHDFSGWIQRYDRISQVLSESELRHGHVLEADCFLIDAASLWEKASNKLKENPLFFVDKI